MKDLQLEEGDFLVFYLVAEHAFHVAVYDPTCCLKKIPVAATSSELYSSPQSFSKNLEKSREILHKLLHAWYIMQMTAI